MILEQSDRWIVQPRQVVVRAAKLRPGGGVEIDFDTNLHIEISGPVSLVRTPNEGADLESIETIAEVVGAGQGSLVLFDSGSIRVVFSNGMLLRAGVGSGGYIRCHRPGDFDWLSSEGGVERSRADE